MNRLNMISHLILIVYEPRKSPTVVRLLEHPSFVRKVMGPGEVLKECLGREVRLGRLNPDPV